MEVEFQKLLEKQRAETEAQQLLPQQHAEVEMKQFIRHQLLTFRLLLPNKLFHFRFRLLLL